MKRLSWKEIARPALMLAVICLIVTSALAVTRAVTKGPTEELERQQEIASRQEVLPDAASFEEMTDSGFDMNPYRGLDASGQAVGYVITTTGKGYGGSIKVMTGISADGAVTGVTILSHSETVGLGANAEKESFRDQYKQAVPEGGFSVYKAGQEGGDGKILAMTGATITSDGVTGAVNQAVEIYRQIAGSGEGGN